MTNCYILVMLAYIVLKQFLTNEGFANLLNDLEDFSPTIEVVGMGEILLDLGVMTDRRKVKAEAKRLLAVIPKDAGLGIAEGRLIAAIAAKTTKNASIVSKGEETIFLEDKPLSLLPVEGEVLRRLDLLGFQFIGDLTKISQNDLANLFGVEGSLITGLLHGNDETLVVARKQEESLSESFFFDFPVEHVFREIEQAIETLCVTLKKRQLLATRIKVVVSCPKAMTITLSLASPSHDAGRMTKLLRDRFSALKLYGLVSSLVVSLEGFVAAHARQLTLASLMPKANRWRNIERVLERLAIRTESTTLMKVVWDDKRSRIPERRGHFQDLLHENLSRGLYIPKPINVAADTTGVPRLVRAHGRWRPVDFVMEAWEIKDDWWTPQPIARSYFRVQLDNGSILRLFRDQKQGSWYHQNR